MMSMSKTDLLLWLLVCCFAVFVVDYWNSPQHYIYSDKPTSATIWVVDAGWRNEAFISEPGTPNYLISAKIAGREVIYKDTLQQIPIMLELLYTMMVLVAILLFGIFGFKLYFKFKKAEEKQDV